MHVTRTVAALMLCTALAMAQSGAVLTANGPVYVNGLQASSAAVVTGDKVLTGDAAFASITEVGSNVVIGKKTSGSLDVRRFVLNQGSASVATSSAYAVQAGSLVITPQSPKAHYEIARLNCRIAVVAHETPLTLSDGTTVRAGQTMNRLEPNCAADAPPAAASAGSAGVSRSGIIIGGAAVAGSLLPSALSSSQPKASPSRPRR